MKTNNESDKRLIYIELINIFQRAINLPPIKS